MPVVFLVFAKRKSRKRTMVILLIFSKKMRAFCAKIDDCHKVIFVDFPLDLW